MLSFGCVREHIVVSKADGGASAAHNNAQMGRHASIEVGCDGEMSTAIPACCALSRGRGRGLFGVICSCFCILPALNKSKLTRRKA